MSKTPYRRGAEDGLKFGIYLGVLLFSSLLSGKVAWLAQVFCVMAILVPVIIYRMMVSYKRELGGVVTFSMLWMQGLVIFSCAAVIAGGAMMIYLRWIDPDYMVENMRQLASLDVSGDRAGLAGYKDMAQIMLDNKSIPRVVDIVVMIILMAITSGSLLSMLLAGIIIARLKYKENRILRR